MAHAQFRVLDVTAEKILQRHKKVKLIAQFRESTEQKQDLEGHNSAKIGDVATKAFDVTQFLLRKLKNGQEAFDFNKEPAVNRAIEHINDFTKKIEAKANIDNRNSKFSTNDDLDEDIAIFTEDILQCFIKKNKFLGEVKGQKIVKLKKWLQSHGQAIVEESNRIMSKIGINSDNFAKKRISFVSAQFISLHEDLPDTLRVETTQQPAVESKNRHTAVSLLKNKRYKMVQAL